MTKDKAQRGVFFYKEVLELVIGEFGGLEVGAESGTPETFGCQESHQQPASSSSKNGVDGGDQCRKHKRYEEKNSNTWNE